MPELPEVESARQVIADAALGRTIADVDDTDRYECRPHEPGEIREALLGRTLLDAHRRGKSIWCPTSDGGPDLGIHLGMSGRIVVDAHEGGDRQRGPARKEGWYRFSLTFDDGGRLRLLDKRRLGRVRLDPDVEALGPDAGDIGREEFRERVGRGTAPLKARLLDQATLAGVGNLLADQTLWQARLDPRRPAGSLSTEELDELRRQLRQAIRHAIRHGGVHTGEVIGHRGRGEHCPRCGAEMARATVGGRTTYWCPAEQG
ncbi:formamidopyrimidine-DNA glycosylase [Nocardioides mangrovicus]|uniref:Formamidopyrimidine-DNA glycosylase n=1 Tax=Nocardioides mangrovicus TaxID=2478913 RepID=A0A3L8NX92_9ACTN|nr:DNA-formamidopyrimidine glycosylase family protein [Nocardioides mangrovicus]RLV47795.1 formamidopyrimidine-DNA glycosylase [Nocardioides mangrovicus]